MATDIEIARAAELRPIADIAERAGIPVDALEPHGKFIAKVDTKAIPDFAGKPDGKLILVTAINPTPAGEGKTTTTVGLGDGISRIGKSCMIALREPSLGPASASRAARPAAVMPRSCRWSRSTCISPATSTPSPARTTCSPP